MGADPTPPAPSARQLGVLATVVLVATVALFWPATGFEFLDVDDPVFVTGNPAVQQGVTPSSVSWAFSEFHASNWVPLTFVSLMADTSIWGTGPRGYHTTNVILHALNTLLLFIIAIRLRVPPPVATILVLLFALHPMRAESVAWIAERKDVLSSLFWFATTAVYIEWTRRGGRGWYALALGLFAMGLMSKAMLVTLPVTLLLLDATLLQRGRTWSRLLLEKGPFFALSFGAAAITVAAQGTGTAMTGMEHLGFADRITNAIVGYATYPLRLVWPADLAWFYPHPSFRPPYAGWPAMQVAGSGLLLATVSAAAWVMSRRGHIGVFAGWAFYLVTLLPVIGLVQVGMQATADRYTYVPHLGLLWMIAAVAATLRPRVRLTAGIVAVIASAAWTTQELPYWRDSESLFRRAVANTSQNGVAHKALGNHLVRRGQYDEGIEELEDAVRILPRFADAHADLGIALVAAGRDAEAEDHLRSALASLPEHARAHAALGNLLARRGDLVGASAAYRRAVESDPGQWEAQLGLALIARARGREQAARKFRDAAVAAAPDAEARRIIEERLR